MKWGKQHPQALEAERIAFKSLPAQVVAVWLYGSHSPSLCLLCTLEAVTSTLYRWGSEQQSRGASLPSPRRVPDEQQPSCNSPFKIAGSQKGGAFVSLPSRFRVRAGLSQEDEVSVYEAGNQESQHSAPGCGNKAISSSSSQEGKVPLPWSG